MIKNSIQSMTLLGALLVAASCTSQVGNDPSQVTAFSPKPSNFRLNLTDAPNEDLTSVVVTIASVEIALEKGEKKGRVQIAQNIGEVDLLTLQNGKILPLDDLDIPEGVSVRQLRLILADDGHFAVKDSGEICPLKTPSAQQSGLKVKFGSPVTIRPGYSYSLVVDFDAKKSVVIRGKGDCLLKPVLRIPSFHEIAQEDVNEDGSSEDSGENLANEDESTEEVVSEEPEDSPNQDDLIYSDDPSTWPDVPEEEMDWYF